MIPTSIDGTDITGATIDGTDVQEITVDGDSVFTAETIIEDFESGNLNNWVGNTGAYSVTTTLPFTGSFSIDMDGSEGSDSIRTYTGVGRTPQQGDTFEFRIYHENTTAIRMGFAVPSGISDSQSDFYNGESYKIQDAHDGFDMFDEGDSTRLINQSHSPRQNEWCRFLIEWGASGNFRVRKFDESGATLTDDTFTDTQYTSGGIGWTNQYNWEGYIDDWKIL